MAYSRAAQLGRREYLERMAAMLAATTVPSSLLPRAEAEPTLLRQTTSVGRMPDYPMVGEKTAVQGLEPIRVEGVGLVVGLRGTGSDPPPNKLRDQLMEEMKRRETAKPRELLADPSTALVLLRAFVPGGARKGDRLDVEVWVPPGDDTTSLRGGWLMESTLKTTVISKNGVRTGDDYIKVSGPVLISGEPGPVGVLKGKVLGGGIALRDMDFRVLLDSAIRSAKRTREMAHYINQRFRVGSSHPGDQIASAITDNRVDLKLFAAYRYDILRYLIVTRFIPLSGSRTLTDTILPALQEALLRPATTIEAALRLEALGRSSTTALQAGLESSAESIRFASAQSLAYIGDASGAKELGRLARESIEYRAHAISALVALDHAQARMQLAQLLNSPGAETRYGAFRAMWARDPGDPLIRGEAINDTFFLHVVPSRTEPMVHVARNFRPELTIFGDRVTLQSPMTLKAGSDITITAQGGGQVFVTGIVRTNEAPRKETGICSPDLADIIRHIGKLGGTYPDVVEFLQQAKQQGNLAARLEINALPKPLSLESQAMLASLEGETLSGAKLETASKQLPSLFQVSNSVDDTPATPLRRVDGGYRSDDGASGSEKSGLIERLMFWKKD